MALQLINNKPNPLYLFTVKEVFDVANTLFPQEERETIGLNYVYLDFCSDESVSMKLPQMNFQHYRQCWKDCTFVALTILPSPLQTPHHVHEDGSIEMMPGREGPVRTYYDGSSIASLVRTAVTVINHELGTITTQCPRGLDFTDEAEHAIQAIYGDFKRVKITDVQQTDHHSTNLYTLYNMLAMSGLRQPRTQLDAAAWRAEVMDVLKIAEADAEPGRKPSSPPITGDAPVYRKRYI